MILSCITRCYNCNLSKCIQVASFGNSSYEYYKSIQKGDMGISPNPKRTALIIADLAKSYFLKLK